MSRRAASGEVMATRAAVAASLDGLAVGERVLVACSGGPDSMALVAATWWVAERTGRPVGAVVVDHGLQSGSDRVAAEAVLACRGLGMPADAVRVEVGRAGGPEAAAREARYAALTRAAGSTASVAVLLGHTREDQAETVLQRLARGSGARSLAAMAPVTGLWRRPFLGLARADVRAAATEALAPLGREPWADPHNADRDFGRVRVRALLDGLAADLGPGVVLGLARSAELLRDDADALDALAEAAFEEQVRVEGDTASAPCSDLALLPRAVRTRVVRLMARHVGCPADAVGIDHVRRIDALVVDWHGQGGIRLPGGVVAERACGRLCLLSGPETGVARGA